MSGNDPAPPPGVPVNPWVMRGRFALANCAGAVVDLAIALLVRTYLAPPLWVAAGLGVLAGGLVNYFAHEFWTFGSGGKATASRAMVYVAACLALLVIRTAVVAVLEATAGASAPDLLILLIAFAISFGINYAVSSRFFRRT